MRDTQTNADENWDYQYPSTEIEPVESTHASSSISHRQSFTPYVEYSGLSQEAMGGFGSDDKLPVPGQYPPASPSYEFPTSQPVHYMDYYGLQAPSINSIAQPTQNIQGSYYANPNLGTSYHLDQSAISTHAQSPPMYQYSNPIVASSNMSLPVPQAIPNTVINAHCRWGQCNIILDDTSPAGIARHLKERHFNQTKPWHNRARGVCEWLDWEGVCNRDMNYQSFGKHIAAVHLRSTASRCPHCQHELGRLDSLERHIKNYCPKSPC